MSGVRRKPGPKAISRIESRAGLGFLRREDQAEGLSFSATEPIAVVQEGPGDDRQHPKPRRQGLPQGSRNWPAARVEFEQVHDHVADVRRRNLPVRARVCRAATEAGRHRAWRNMSFPPKYGEHTQSVLAEAGYSIAECTSLAEQGIIA